LNSFTNMNHLQNSRNNIIKTLEHAKKNVLCSPVRDIITGLIMAGTSVPQLLAYAETVGYAGYRGLATAGPSLLAWGFVTSSPWANSGVTSLTALMTKADLNGEEYLNEFGEEKYVELVSAYSLYVGIASFFLVLTGFGSLASKIPKNVRSGFKWGCAIGVLNACIPNALLARGSSDVNDLVQSTDFLSTTLSFMKENLPSATGATTLIKIFYILTHPNTWSIIPALLFFFSTIFVMRGKSYLPKFLPPGMEVIIATAIATFFSIHTNYSAEYGTVGEIPTLDPESGISLLNGSIHLPIEIQSYEHLLFNVPLVSRFNDSYFYLFLSASIFAMINFLSIVGIVSAFESENGIPCKPSRELVSQGFACIVAGLTGSAPVSGSLSRSLVSRMAGATSQFACMVTAMCWICFLPYMSIMTPTPKSALSAIIVSAVARGVLIPKDLLAMRNLDDRIVAWGTGIATACLSPTLGFGSGILLFILVSMVHKIFLSDRKKVKSP